MAVSVHTLVEFHPFAVPHAIRPFIPDCEESDTPAYELGEVGIEVIDALAAEWLGNLYANIGQASPFKLEPRP